MTQSLRPAAWTLMVFMNGKNNLEPFAIENFYQMASAPGSPRVNVLAELGRRGQTNAKYHGYGKWSGTYIFKISHGIRALPQNALRLDGVPQPNAVDMGDASSVSSFVKFAMVHFPAQHYMLIMWDHGQGWRLMRYELQSAASADKVETIAQPLSSYMAKGNTILPISGSVAAGTSISEKSVKTLAIATAPPLTNSYFAVAPPVKSVSEDDSTQNHIYNRQLEDALKETLGKRKLDIIGFDACLMAMVEVDYAFRDVASYATASEESEPGGGWNYETFIGYLDKHPNIGSRALASEAVTAYKKAYSGNAGDSTTLSVFDLSAAEQLANSIDKLSVALRRDIPGIASQVSAIRAQLNTYGDDDSSFPYIDLKEFTDELGSSSSSLKIKEAAAAVSTAVSKAVIAHYASPDEIPNFGSYGVAIYFPDSLDLFLAEPAYEPDNVESAPVEFVRSHDWSRFLRTYLEYEAARH
ncbi:MAG: clostripain-related cysteine peptidase [Candidatus Cybelea sp.]